MRLSSHPSLLAPVGPGSVLRAVVGVVGCLWLSACGTDDVRLAELESESSRKVDLTQVTEVDPATQPDGVPETSRLRRLTYEEYDAAVSDLLGMQVDASTLFPTEDATLGSYHESPRITVNDRLMTALRSAAETLAQMLVATPQAYEQHVSCEIRNTSCRNDFLQRFALRAYRRSPTDDELGRLSKIFDAGDELIASGDPFRDGVQLVVEVMLQSAKFLYQIEQGSEETSDIGEELSDYELASRLSFVLWGRMPDEELFHLAAEGTLRANLDQQVERMLASPKLASRVETFHKRWLHLDAALSTSKDPARFPTFTPQLAADMGVETQGFILEITLNQDGGIRELLTSPLAYINDALASHYGVLGTFGTRHILTSFPFESGRRGLLTQGAFLIGHASTQHRTSPILRGTFLLRHVLCSNIPNPPPGSEMQEPAHPLGSGRVTTRDFFEWKTSVAGCASCHDQINPLGFAFESFDAVGNHRSEEAGAPIDSSGSLDLHGETLSFSSATDAIEGIAELPIVRACYAKQWLNYLYGRAEQPEDLRTLAVASQGLNTEGFGVRGVLTAVTRSAAFSHLSPLPN